MVRMSVSRCCCDVGLQCGIAHYWSTPTASGVTGHFGSFWWIGKGQGTDTVGRLLLYFRKDGIPGLVRKIFVGGGAIGFTPPGATFRVRAQVFLSSITVPLTPAQIFTDVGWSGGIEHDLPAVGIPPTQFSDILTITSEYDAPGLSDDERGVIRVMATDETIQGIGGPELSVGAALIQENENITPCGPFPTPASPVT